MTDQLTPLLSQVPAQLSIPRDHIGTYKGETHWSAPIGRVEGLLKEKKWQWFGLFDDNYAVGGAIVDAGYAGKSFVWVFDRKAGKLVTDVTKTLPAALVRVADSPAADGEVAKLSGPSSWSFERTGARWLIQGQLGEVSFDLVLEEHMTPMTAVCPNGDLYNITRKNVSLSGRGRVSSPQLGDVTMDGLGLLDHSHGLMLRETQWKWAIGAGVLADGSRIGFNLIHGFNGDKENVFWLGDDLRALPPVKFDRTTNEWRVYDADGMVDITLTWEGERCEDLNLGLVISKYTQPLGTWSGTIAGVEFEGLVGVGEDHFAKW